MNRSQSIGVLSAAVLLLVSSQSFGQGVQKATADIVGQRPAGPVVAEGGATLLRTPRGITVSMTMPTPMPGSYAYPPDPSPWQPAPVPGFPEVFTGWAFVFNDPGTCASSPCAGPTLVSAEGRIGVYNFAGHVVGGRTLNLVGHISIGEPVFGHPNPDANNPLDNPGGAEVHLAIAPHGALLPDFLPDQITTPVGNPNFWWVALFIPE
jgi:hypothetical protein